MIGKIVSHYRILEKFGGGGMGVVYKAEDTKLHRTVALKFLPPELTRDEEAKQRFIHEARAASSLQHHNICTVHNIDETEDGQIFICMDLYEGQTLKQKIQQGPLNIDEAIDIAIQIAAGMQKAHEKGIVHRDIKPANIFITNDGVAKILDFGLAKLSGQTMMTKVGSTVGTAAYMSPEQAKGEEVDHRTDIWSLGVVLYEMLTGQKPFKGDYEQAIIYSVINDEPEMIYKTRANVPLKMEKIVNRLLSKNPQKRYNSPSEVLEELNSIKENKVERKYRQLSFRIFGIKRSTYLYIITSIFLFLIGLVIYTQFILDHDAKQVSLVLLPLKNISDANDQDWFTDGITEALITDLAKISSLRVISRSSAMKFKTSDKTPSEIARALGVSYLVEGSVLKINNQVKINTRIIDAEKDEYIWAQEFDRDFKNILSLQSEVSQSIASQIRVKITPFEQNLLNVRHEINPQAYEAYLKGEFYYYKLNKKSLEVALDYFNLASKLDPNSALAYVGIARVWTARMQNGYSPFQIAHEERQTAALKALEIDSTLAEVHKILGSINTWGVWNWKVSEFEFKKAIQLNPNLADAHAGYSHVLYTLKRFEEAKKQIKLAIELDPLNTHFQGFYAMGLMYEHRYDEVINLLEKIRESTPQDPLALSTLRSAYHQKGMYEKALDIWKASFEANKDSEAVVVLEKGISKGGYSTALKSVAELMIQRSKTRFITPWQIATLYTRAGMKNEAIEWFEKAYEAHDPNMSYLNIDPIFDYLQDDPRVKSLIKRMNL